MTRKKTARNENRSYQVRTDFEKKPWLSDEFACRPEEPRGKPAKLGAHCSPAPAGLCLATEEGAQGELCRGEQNCAHHRIPYASPLLVEHIADRVEVAASAAAVAVEAVRTAPTPLDHEDRVVAAARILKATALALRMQDDDFLSVLEEKSRSFLRKNRDVEVHHEGKMRGGYAYSSGGDVEKTTEDIVSDMRGHLVDYLEWGRVGRKRNTPTMDVEEMAQHFVHMALRPHGSSRISTTLARKGIIVGYFHSDDWTERNKQKKKWEGLVADAFGKALARLEGEPPEKIASADTAEALVIRGFEALGYPGARNLFDFERKRTKR